MRPLYNAFVRILSKVINVVSCLAYFGGSPIRFESRLLAVSSKRLARAEAALVHDARIGDTGCLRGGMLQGPALDDPAILLLPARFRGASKVAAGQDVECTPMRGGQRRGFREGANRVKRLS